MKSLSTLTFLFLAFQISIAQDWSLFPEGQKNYWDTNLGMKLFYNDATESDSLKNTHFFGALYLTKDSSYQCYWDILEYEYQLEEPPIDSMFSNDEYWFDYLNGDKIRFYHLAEPGFTWVVNTPSHPNFDSLKFVCILKVEEEFIGVTDSVKKYDMVGYKNGSIVLNPVGYEYQLSKLNGLIKYIPFNSIVQINVIQEIIGFDDGQPHGFTSSWENFFGEFEAGQKLKWKYYREEIFVPQDYWSAADYYIDSITQVEFNDSFLRLNVERYGRSYYGKMMQADLYNYDSTSSFQTAETLTYLRKNFQSAMDAPPGWFNFDKNEQVANYHINTGPNNYYYQTNYYFWDTTQCDILIAHPSSLGSEITRGLGHTYWGISGGLYGEHYEYELIGYTIDGEEFGDVLNPVFSRPVPSLFFNVSPNPATGFINIELLEKNNFEELNIKIVDVAGKIILNEKSKNNFHKINIENIDSGIYFIVVEGEQFFGREKFIKF